MSRDHRAEAGFHLFVDASHAVRGGREQSLWSSVAAQDEYAGLAFEGGHSRGKNHSRAHHAGGSI